MLLALAVLGFLIALAAPWLMHQVDIDRCLDAGGAYDYHNEACVGAQGD